MGVRCWCGCGEGLQDGGSVGPPIGRCFLGLLRMRGVNSFSDKVGFIWSVADLLRGPYRPNQYGRVVLPLTVLRRLGILPSNFGSLGKWTATGVPVSEIGSCVLIRRKTDKGLLFDELFSGYLSSRRVKQSLGEDNASNVLPETRSHPMP